MTIWNLCLSLVIGGCMLAFAEGEVQAQVGSGSGSGGAVGQGGPDITRPETGGRAPEDGTRSPDRSGGTLEPGQDSGKMKPEGAIIMKPKPGEKEAPGSGRPPDRSTLHPGTGSGSGGSGGMESSGGGGGK